MNWLNRFFRREILLERRCDYCKTPISAWTATYSQRRNLYFCSQRCADDQWPQWLAMKHVEAAREQFYNLND